MRLDGGAPSKTPRRGSTWRCLVVTGSVGSRCQVDTPRLLAPRCRERIVRGLDA